MDEIQKIERTFDNIHNILFDISLGDHVISDNIAYLIFLNSDIVDLLFELHHLIMCIEYLKEELEYGKTIL
jgi:hypothetical protein